MDDDQLKDMAAAACQEALAFGVSEEAFMKLARSVRERICAAIKAEDDHCATGDYMLDSDDCIKVARGEWERPDYTFGANPMPNPDAQGRR